MLTLPPTVRIFVSLAPADMRRSLDGLAALTREVRKRPVDPVSNSSPGFGSMWAGGVRWPMQPKSSVSDDQLNNGDRYWRSGPAAA